MAVCSIADKAKAQFSQLCSQASEEWLQMFSSFDWNKERLDVFTIKSLDPKRNSKRSGVSFRLYLFYLMGNARVESCFSVNADMLVQNLKEESLIAQRRVYDSTVARGGFLNVNISTSNCMVLSAISDKFDEW